MEDEVGMVGDVKAGVEVEGDAVEMTGLRSEEEGDGLAQMVKRDEVDQTCGEVRAS